MDQRQAIALAATKDILVPGILLVQMYEVHKQTKWLEFGALTRLRGHLGKVGYHLDSVAGKMTTDPVHKALPSFLQR